MKKVILIAIICLVNVPFKGKAQGTMNLTLTGNAAKCNGNSNGSASVVVSGGTAPYTYNWAPIGGTSSIAGNLTAGSYTVTVKDNKGITATGIVAVNQPAPLQVTIDSNVVRPCFLLTGPGGGGSCGCGNTVWATVNGGTVPYSYAWTPNGNTTDTITQACYVEFSVTVTDSNKCLAVDSLYIAIPSITTGIDQLTAPTDIKIYPVPANDVLNITINQLAADTRILEVYDMMGKAVLQEKLKENTAAVSLNVDALPNGNYLLRIIGDYSQHTARFSISR